MASTLSNIRRWLLLVLLIGLFGMGVELLLLKHTDGAWQLVTPLSPGEVQPMGGTASYKGQTYSFKQRVNAEVEYVIGLPGDGHETEVFFSDLSHEYVTINAEYTT